MSDAGALKAGCRRRPVARLLAAAVFSLAACAGGMGAGSSAAGDGPAAVDADIAAVDAEAAIVDADLAIVDVSVIPMDREGVLEGRTVLVRDGRIVSIAPAREVVPGDRARVVDGRGRYLIPGLADMHVHVYGETELPLYVANGVTRIRNMWGSHTSLAMRARADSGTIIAPRIRTAGRLVDGESPIWGETSAVAPDPATALRIMDEEKAAGFDFLKIYERLSPETFEATMAHSRAIGHPVAGHVPRAVRLEDALRSGMASIEHLSAWARATERFRPEGPAEGAAVLRRIEAGEAGWDTLYDPERLQSLAALAAEHGVWHVPTLSWLRGVYTSRRQARESFAGADMRYMSPLRRASWDPSTNLGLRRLTDETLEAFQVLLEADQLRVRALHEAGARILVGTDPPNPFVLHGFAIHQELELLVESGLSPYEALVAATRGPAEFVGRPDEGTVVAGNRADLVLLGSNPLLDVSATRDIAGVVLRGRWHSREDLDAMLESVVTRYRPPDDWFAGMASLPEGAEVRSYSTVERALKIGAERIGRFGRDGPGRVTVAQRTTLSASGDRVSETVRITTRRDGSVAELVYTQAPASGTARVRVSEADGRLAVAGRTVDGQPIERSVALAPGEIVSCEMIACLALMLPRADGLALGERRQLPARTLVATVGSRAEASGNPVFVRENWEWVRAPDEGDARAYEVTVSRNTAEWTLEVTADATGLLLVERAGRRQLETRRDR